MITAILVFMIFAHIVDDFYLQGILAKMKQESWWKENAPDKLYENDWVIALFLHSLSWAISITLPIIIWSLINNYDLKWFYLSIIINAFIHFEVDDMKANRHKLNLVADQSVHILQVCLTWTIWIFTTF